MGWVEVGPAAGEKRMRVTWGLGNCVETWRHVPGVRKV